MYYGVSKSRRRRTQKLIVTSDDKRRAIRERTGLQQGIETLLSHRIGCYFAHLCGGHYTSSVYVILLWENQEPLYYRSVGVFDNISRAGRLLNSSVHIDIRDDTYWR